MLGADRTPAANARIAAGWYAPLYGGASIQRLGKKQQSSEHEMVQ
jgi:hypothetical protein